MRDLFNNVVFRTMAVPGSRVASFNSAVANVAIGRSVVVTIHVGSIAVGAEWSVKLQESDDGVTWADVPASKILGDVPALLTANWAFKFGYLGNKGYIRAAYTMGAAGSIQCSATAVIVPLTRPSV